MLWSVKFNVILAMSLLAMRWLSVNTIRATGENQSMLFVKKSDHNVVISLLQLVLSNVMAAYMIEYANFTVLLGIPKVN